MDAGSTSRKILILDDNNIDRETCLQKAPPAEAKQILLVEDHADTARILARIIESEGYQVRVAGSIAQAVDLYRKQACDCVISDIGLPDGTGMELLARLSSIQPVKGIALSGYCTERDVAQSRQAGFSQHLTKPVHWPQLQKALNEVFRQ